tara:strand:- start:1869 stop:2063 length:195 start_codon:yes stop_codon:yes gene_type:complete
MEKKMRTVGNILIGIGIIAVIIGSMMVDDTYMPMTNKQFAVQIACFIGGLGVAFIGILVSIMEE